MGGLAPPAHLSLRVWASWRGTKQNAVPVLKPSNMQERAAANTGEGALLLRGGFSPAA